VEWRNAYAFIQNHKIIANTNSAMRSQGKDLRLEVNN
jgi:C1A family cysteine protease